MNTTEQFEEPGYIEVTPYRVVLIPDTDEYLIGVKRGDKWWVIASDILQCDDYGEHWWFRETGNIYKRYVEALEDALNEKLSKKPSLPADYEACGQCGFDHSYEQQEAHNWHTKNTE